MKVELKCDYMRISGHTWTSTIKTQDIWKLAQYLTYVCSI